MISFAPVFVRVAHVGPTVSAFYRLAIGGVILWTLVVARGGRRWFGARHLGLSAAAGALLALDLAVWHRSIGFVGPGLATILANFQVFFLAAFGVLFLHERLTPRVAVAIPLAMLGLAMLVGLDWRSLTPSYRVGVVLGLCTALAYAAYLLILRRAQAMTQLPDATVTVAALAVIAAPLLAVSVVLEGESFRVADFTTLGALLGLALGPQVLGWVLISSALPAVRASQAGLVLLLQPSLAFVWDMLFFSRPTTVVEGVGAVIALSAIYLGTVGWGRPE